MRLALFTALILSLAAVMRAGEPAVAVPTTTLRNVFKLEDALYSGNSPDNEEAFRELTKLGVKTIISVDGGKPNLELAHKFGMRYVHLPIGYDAVPKSRAAELVKAAMAADGPLYVHCHHGKHRGPAAAATICRARDGWTAERADAFLRQAGTAADYAGLFRDVREFQPPIAEELARLPSTFPEIADTPDLVDAMVVIDEYFEALKAAQKAGWRKVPSHPDLTPAQSATLLWEQFREMARTGDTAQRNDDYRSQLAESKEAADALRLSLGESRTTSERDAAFQRVTKNCAACHKAHRN
jgi:protein tyrosine phosphatase (PTP) superfamily phosphohydrolase (DUF442 family)